MRRLLWFALGLAACGEPADEPHPRCAEETTTGWSCAAAYGSARERCDDGQLVEESCAADEWCLSWADAGAAPYEGRCVSKQIDYRCPNNGAGPCPDGLSCYLGICRTECFGVDVPCPIEGQECWASAVPGQETDPVCIYASEKP